MTPYPFQIKGAEWLSEKRYALLADEMGLGKSAQAILAADNLLASRVLILCPAVARINWSREFRKFSTFNRPFQIILKGDDRPKTDHSIITSYELAVRFFERGDWQGHRFDVIVMDEAHFLKSANAKRTKAILGKHGLVHQGDRVWALTGTPMPNHPGELWVLLKVFGVTKLTYYQFVTEYCQMPYGWREGDPLQVIGARKEKQAQLKELLSKVMLRRLASDELDLPPMMLTDTVVEPGKWELSAEEKKMLEADFERIGANGGVDGPIDDAFLDAFANSVATLRRYNGCRKIEPVAKLVEEELEAGEYSKVVLFAIHRTVVAELAARLRRFLPVTVTGATTPQARQKAVDEFQSNPSCRVFIGNIRAAGTAITLTAADQVVMVEQEWVPGDNMQAIKRCHRISQTRPVMVRCVGIADSIDEKISAILRRKTQDILSIIG